VCRSDWKEQTLAGLTWVRHRFRGDRCDSNGAINRRREKGRNRSAIAKGCFEICSTGCGAVQEFGGACDQYGACCCYNIYYLNIVPSSLQRALNCWYELQRYTPWTKSQNKALGKHKASYTRLTLLLAVVVKAATLAKPVKCIVETTAGTVAFLLTVVLVLLDLVISA